MLKQRSKQLEIIDLGPDHYSPSEYRDCLMKLDRVGRWLGGDAATIQALKKMDPAPKSILDVGCGGGFLAKRMAEAFPSCEVVGLDINPSAIQFAKENFGQIKNLRFTQEWNEEPKSYDAITATLVCHHFDDKALIDFLQTASRGARRKVLINDLQRGLLPLGLFNLIAPIFFRNRLVLHDGPISVKKGFTKSELERFLAEAGIDKQSSKIYWRWAFRWIIECNL